MKLIQTLITSAVALVATAYMVANTDRFHRGPSGFGSVTRAREICDSTVMRNGESVAIVTGASNGIGFETAKAIWDCGYSVVVPGRTLQQSQDTVKRLQASSSTGKNKGKLLTGELQLDDLTSVRKFATYFKSLQLPLHVLVENAGVMALPNRTSTKQGFEQQMGVNHVAHALLFHELAPILEASKPSRLVVVSSMAWRLSTDPDWLSSSSLESVAYDPWRAYGNSKMANVLFARCVDHMYKDKGIRAFSVHRMRTLRRRNV